LTGGTFSTSENDLLADGGSREAPITEPGSGTSSSQRLDRPLLWTAIAAAMLLVPLPADLFPAADPLAGGAQPDLLVHVALFAALARAWLGGGRAARTGTALAGVAAVTAYGGLLELVQPAVGRSAEWADLAADLVGALAGWAWARHAARRTPL